MKKYLSNLRWYLGAAAVLPLLCQVTYTSVLPSLSFDNSGLGGIFSLMFLALFYLGGRKAASGGYPVTKACFAGPLLLFVSNIIVGIPLEYIRLLPHVIMGNASHAPTWLRILLLPARPIITYLIVFPVTLGIAALAAHLYGKRK